MNTPVNPWPCDIGTTRGTGLEAVEQHIDAMPSARYHNLHRVTLAAPGPQEIPAAELARAQREAAERREIAAAVRAGLLMVQMPPQPAECGTEVGAEQQGHPRIPRKQRMPEGGLISTLLVAVALAGAIGGAVALWVGR